MTNSDSSSGGIGLCGATFIVFLVLKLTKCITWSWWWVAAPMWIPIVIALVAVGIIGAITLIEAK